MFGDFEAEVDVPPIVSPKDSSDPRDSDQQADDGKSGARLAKAVKAFGSTAHFNYYALRSGKPSKIEEDKHLESDDLDVSAPLPTVPEIIAPGVDCSIPP